MDKLIHLLSGVSTADKNVNQKPGVEEKEKLTVVDQTESFDNINTLTSQQYDPDQDNKEFLQLKKHLLVLLW